MKAKNIIICIILAVIVFGGDYALYYFAYQQGYNKGKKECKTKYISLEYDTEDYKMINNK